MSITPILKDIVAFQQQLNELIRENTKEKKKKKNGILYESEVRSNKGPMVRFIPRLAHSIPTERSGI